MRKTVATIILAALVSCLHAQQLYIEAFTGVNSTQYDLAAYSDASLYAPFGFRLAGGGDHFQIGAEYRQNLTDPAFDVSEPSAGKDEFTETYYGVFGRMKVCRYPAMRFGLVLRAGAGLYDMEKKFNPDSGTGQSIRYDNRPGVNAGAGFSMPLAKHVMLELSYNYHLVNRPELKEFGLPGYRASYHAVQAGLSLNFVFGDRAKKYRETRENSRWKGGRSNKDS